MLPASLQSTKPCVKWGKMYCFLVTRAHEYVVCDEGFDVVSAQLTAVDISSAFRIAAAQEIYAYDAYFLECAMRMRSPLLTLDRRMRFVAGELGIQILE